MNKIMKKEWSKIELKFVLFQVNKWLNSRKFESYHGDVKFFTSVEQMDKVLGLAYTSSGRAACVSICNTELYLDARCRYIVRSFEMNEDCIVFAVCWDKNENELLIPINS